MRRTVVVMAKPPLMGRAKTRLAAGAGAVPAVRFARFGTAALLRRWRDPRWALILAVDAAPGERHACWPADIARSPQGQGNLGDRMRRVARRLPPGPVLFVGTDAPQVSRTDIAAAFAALGAREAVVGPAVDGGYWLLGLARRRPAPRLFEGVRWSTEHALADTLASLPEGWTVPHLRSLRDVDEASDLEALRREDAS